MEENIMVKEEMPVQASGFKEYELIPKLAIREEV